MFLIVRFGFEEDNDIIEVYYYNFLLNEVLKGIIYNPLEGERSISKIERYNNLFILIILSIKYRFSDKRFFYFNLIISRG